MLEILTIQHYSENLKEVKRITLSVEKIFLISAATDDIVINGLNLREVFIYFEDGGQIDVIINHSDLSMLERAVGTFYAPS